VNAIVYDVEIARGIPDGREAPDPALEYCAGWHDHAHMGIAVVCAYDLVEEQPRIFLEDNLAAFAALAGAREHVIGFNSQMFDDRVLEAHGIRVRTTYDVLQELRAVVRNPRAPGRKLDDICRVNLGSQKSGSGALAPVLWQRGQRGAVVDYCMRDVMLTVALVRKLPTLIDPVTGHRVTLRGLA
jgi:hypothetical protein